ncbi:MAG: NINE protein [Dehalococcoidales bacterium]|nr:NINE protein [Dehalococcoidales bacterium]
MPAILMDTPTGLDSLTLHREIARRRKGVWTAWLLWLLLGFCGAHRFYLGRFRSGMVMLILAVFVITGFIMSLVFHVIGPLYGTAIGLAILVLLIWPFVDIFLLPGMLRAERERVEEEAVTVNKAD